MKAIGIILFIALFIFLIYLILAKTGAWDTVYNGITSSFSNAFHALFR